MGAAHPDPIIAAEPLAVNLSSSRVQVPLKNSLRYEPLLQLVEIRGDVPRENEVDLVVVSERRVGVLRG